MPLTRGMEEEYQEKIATLVAEKQELAEEKQHIAVECERTVAELRRQLANLQLQVEEAEEARRQEGETWEDIRQLRQENQEFQRRIYEKEELIHLQKEQVAVMHDSMQDLRQQKNDYRERQQEWRQLVEKREKENECFRIELEQVQKRWMEEAEGTETRAWVPLTGAVLESNDCGQQSAEQVGPDNVGDPRPQLASEMAPTLVTSTADAILLERPLSVGTISASSVPDRPQVPLWPTAVMPVPTPITTATEINQQQLYYPTRQPGTSTVQQKDPVVSQPHYPSPHQPLSRNFHQHTEHSTVGNGQQGPSTVDSGQVLQQLAASVAEKQRKCPKFSGESKYDDFDHWLQNIFRFYVALDRYDERGKLLELRSALKEGSPAQRAFDFLELLAYGSFALATQRLRERFRCMLTPEALRVEFSRLRFRPHQQTIQEFATEVEQMSIRTFPHKSPADRDMECRHQFRVGLGDDWAYKLLNCPDTANFHQTLRWVLERAAKQESIRAIKGCGSLKERKDNEWRGVKKQPGMSLSSQPKNKIEAPTRPKNTSNRFGPKTTESIPSQVKRCWKCNEMGHTQHSCPQRNVGIERYVQRQVVAEHPAVPEEKVETKQQYAERIRKLAEQAELEVLKERCTKTSQSNAVTVLSTNNVEVHTESKEEKIAPVVGGSHFCNLEVGGLHVRALIDTGSPATIISEELLHKIMKSSTEITTASLTKPEVQLVDCGQHLLHIVGQITLTFKLIPGAERKVKVLINADSTQSCLLGTNAQEALRFTLVLPDGQEIPRSPAPTVERYTKESSSQTTLPIASPIFTVRLVTTCRIPGYRGRTVEAKVEGDWSQTQSKRFLFEPARETLQKFELDAESSLVECGATIALRVHNYSYSATFVGKDMAIGTVQPCELVLPGLPQGSDEEQEIDQVQQVNIAIGSKEEEKAIAGQVDIDTPTLLAKLWINPELPKEVREQVQDHLIQSADIFALDDTQLGVTSWVEHSIDTGEAKPIKQRPWRTPLAYREKVIALVTDMLARGVVVPSRSSWASPVVLVAKKDGSLRFCVDFRKVNSVTHKDVYPLPRVDDILDSMGKNSAHYFSKLDLRSGYWQVKMAPSDQEKTAFTTFHGLFEFTVMPFGLCNAPATFQRLMEAVLHGLLGNFVSVYLDDIIIYSPTVEDHLKHLNSVFDRLRQAGLRLKPSKCQFLCSQIAYLGHVISADGIHPDPEKIIKIQSWPRPINQKELQRFAGLANYYRRFAKDFAKKFSPLRALLKVGVPFVWTPSAQKAFDEVKHLLTSPPVLTFPRLGQPFEIWTDASYSGLGAALCQEAEDGKIHPVAYASRGLLKHEQNYAVSELEGLAVVWALAHFHAYIVGQDVTVYTDHAALQSLLKAPKLSGRLMRWSLKLQQFMPTIKHRPGAMHVVPDALSRMPQEGAVHAVMDCFIAHREDTPVDITPGLYQTSSLQPKELELTIGSLQQEDAELKAIIDYLKSGILPEDSVQARRLALERPRFSLADGVLFHEDQGLPGRPQLVVPRQVQEQLVQESHDGRFSGHFAEKRTWETLRRQFWWPTMRSDIRKCCNACINCATRTGQSRKKKSPMIPIPIGSKPFEMVGVDVLQLPESYHGNKYAVVFMDYFSKWPEVAAVPNQTAETIGRLLIELLLTRHGAPSYLLSDRGSNFLSELILEVCHLIGTKKINTSGYHAQTDGLVERFNRTLIGMLSKWVDKKGRDWDQQLPYVLWAYRVSPHDSTGESPFFLLHGHDPRLPTELMLGSPSSPYQVDQEDYVSELVSGLSDAWALAKSRIEEAQSRQKQQYDRGIKECRFQIGQRVFVYKPSEIQQKAWKFSHPYHGPFRIIKLTDSNGALVRPTTRPDDPLMLVNFDRLRPCRSEIPDDACWLGTKRIRKPKKPQGLQKKMLVSGKDPSPPKHHYYTRSKTKQMASPTSLEDDRTQGGGDVSRDTVVPLLGTDWFP